MPGVRVRPTDETRRTVRAMAGYGVPHAQIATFIRIDPKSVRKHYRDELDRGMIEANAKVAQTLFTLATVDKNVAAAIFWMKARAGWREKIDTSHQYLGADEEPIDPPQAMTDIDIARRLAFLLMRGEAAMLRPARTEGQ